MDNVATPIPLGPEVEVDDGSASRPSRSSRKSRPPLPMRRTSRNCSAVFLGTMLRLAHATAGVVRVLTTDSRHLRLVGARGLPPDLVERERVVPSMAAIAAALCATTVATTKIDLQDCATRR